VFATLALLAERLSARSRLSVFFLDLLALRTVVVVVVNLSIRRRIFLGVCVICGISHRRLLLKPSASSAQRA
jgi:hypothetical protein